MLHGGHRSERRRRRREEGEGGDDLCLFGRPYDPQPGDGHPRGPVRGRGQGKNRRSAVPEGAHCLSLSSEFDARGVGGDLPLLATSKSLFDRFNLLLIVSFIQCNINLDVCLLTLF